MPTLFFLLMIKHFICDFALQGRFIGRYPFGAKRKLTNPGALLHSLDHALGTAFIFLIVSIIAYTQGHTIFFSILVFGVLDFVLHLFIDWRKNIIVHNLGIKQSDRMFWIITSIDQIFHSACYWLYVVLFDKYFF